MKTNSALASSLLRYSAIAITSVIVISSLISLLGESPLAVAKIFLQSTLFQKDSLSYVLLYASILTFTGLSVAIPLEAGLFNIGAEGQLYIGAVAAAFWAHWGTPFFLVDTPLFYRILFWIFGALFSFMAGGLWAGLAGLLRIYKGVHEVIATIMLNFIAFAFSNFVVVSVLRDTEGQAVETPTLISQLQIPKLWLSATPLLLGALALPFLFKYLLKRTWLGFRIRACGANPLASQLAGISPHTIYPLSFLLAGGLAGLVGFHEVFMNSYRLIDGFSPFYGYTGIAIALLARMNPLSLLAAAFLFGLIQKGALELDLETENLTRDFALVAQALLLMVLVAFERWNVERLWKKKSSS